VYVCVFVCNIIYKQDYKKTGAAIGGMTNCRIGLHRTTSDLNWAYAPRKDRIGPIEIHLHLKMSAFWSHKKVKYVDLYSASSRSASNALPLPVSRHWSPQANPTARHSANTARPRNTGWCITRYACLLRQLTLGTHTAFAGSGWVGLGAWFHAEVVYPVTHLVSK